MTVIRSKYLPSHQLGNQDASLVAVVQKGTGVVLGGFVLYRYLCCFSGRFLLNTVTCHRRLALYMIQEEEYVDLWMFRES